VRREDRRVEGGEDRIESGQPDEELELGRVGRYEALQPPTYKAATRCPGRASAELVFYRRYLEVEAGPALSGRPRLVRGSRYPVVALKLGGNNSPLPKVELSVAFVWGGNGTHVILGTACPFSVETA
jgi:hypothetical protein